MKSETGSKKEGCAGNASTKKLLAALLALASSATLSAQTDGADFSPTGFSLIHGTTLLTPNTALEWKEPSGQTTPGSRVVWPHGPMPFFCRIEHRLGHQMALPLKFRLGDVPYVDRLEGKRRWYE
jgi:hypothetical protein